MKHFRQILFLLFFIPYAAFSQWTDDPNNPLLICNSTGVQKTVHTIGDNSDGYYIFWIDNRDQVAGTAIYGQHVDEDGNSLWPANGKSIYQTAGKGITDFKMVAWQSGILLAWIQNSGGYPDSLLSQYFDTSGDPVWSQPVTVATASSGVIGIGGSAAFNIFPNQLGATIGYYITYTGGSTFFSFNRIDFSGTLAFPNNNFAFSYGAFYDYRSCDDHQNGVYVLMKGNGLGSGMVIQRYDENGTSVFPTPVDFTTGSGGFGGLISMNTDADGSLYITWDSYNASGILATKITATGNFAWSPFYADVSDFNSVQSNSYSILAKDKLYVTWNDNRPNASFAYIYVQKLDTSGTVEWTPGGVQACNFNSYIPDPKLITSDSGSVVAVYEVSPGLLAQKFRPDSTIKYAVNGDTISILTNTPFYSDFELQQGTGGCTIAFWSNEAGDIYGGRICTPETNVGVNELSSDENLVTVFPNPVDDHFTVENSSTNSSQDELFVTDLAGRIAMKILPNEFSSGKDIEVNASSLPSATYLLVLKTSEKIQTQKFIVQH